MENGSPKKSGIAGSILAKFQQYAKEKEEADKEKLNEKSFKTSPPQEQQHARKRKHLDNTLHSGISEVDVGITKFISDHSGFTGILKHRFTDFQVHEIGLDGNVVELTSTKAVDLPVEKFEVNKDAISKEYWDQIDSVLEGGEETVVEIDVSDKDKAERSIIHKTLKAVYGSRIFSNTATKDDKTIIRVGKSTGKDRANWPENLPQFLHFTLTKKNMDTTHFIYLFSKKLRVKPNNFTYAGTKDRRAITSQRMCIRRKKAEELASQTLWGVKIGNYEYKNKCLRLGDLAGNKFTITIRNVKAEDSVINTALESLNKAGFINYFGLQRFGSSAVAPTFHIGKALLKRDWKLAVELILKPRPDEKAPMWIKAARDAWWSARDAGVALRHLCKHQNSIEYKVLQSLKSQPNDYHTALLTIPRNTLLLYLHSYQSYVWNIIVSKRIEMFGMVPQIGDLVLDTAKQTVEDVTTDDIPEMTEKCEDEEELEEEVDESQDIPSEEIIKKKIAVKFLTEEDVKSTSIYDVVYPLAGHDVEFPKNEIEHWYTEILDKDNIKMEDLKSNHKLFSLYGTYRKAFQTAGNLTWKIVKHNNFDDDLVLSDFDKLDNVSLPEQLSDGEHKSVVLDITLSPSTYATMALREVMKSDTSVSFHATLTKNIQVEKKPRLSTNENEASE